MYSSNGGESGLDHPWVVATEDLAGAVTAHVLFWDVDFSTTRYWKRNAGAACPTGTPTAISTALLPSSPPILLRGGTGGTTYLYGITWPTGADGTFAKSWPTICNFATVPPAAADCGKVGRNLSNGPHPVALDIPYGTAQGSRQGACANVGGGWYKCFEAEQPVSLAASQWTANVIGAVYPAPQNGQTAIYFTRSDGASFSTANWRNPPVRIHAAQSTRYYVDPEITVDEEGILFVTWIAITPAPSSTSGSADMYLAYSTDGGETWSSTYDIGGWNANGLPYHCHRREWFLADYRQGTSVGGRALHLLYRGDGTNLYQDSRWLSRWSGMP